MPPARAARGPRHAGVPLTGRDDEEWWGSRSVWIDASRSRSVDGPRDVQRVGMLEDRPRTIDVRRQRIRADLQRETCRTVVGIVAVVQVDACIFDVRGRTVRRQRFGARRNADGDDLCDEHEQADDAGQPRTARAEGGEHTRHTHKVAAALVGVTRRAPNEWR